MNGGIPSTDGGATREGRSESGGPRRALAAQNERGSPISRVHVPARRMHPARDGDARSRKRKTVQEAWKKQGRRKVSTKPCAVEGRNASKPKRGGAESGKGTKGRMREIEENRHSRRPSRTRGIGQPGISAGCPRS